MYVCMYIYIYRSVPAHPARRRVTWMVAFWEDITQRGAADLGPSASRAFPVRGATKYSWCDRLFDPDPAWAAGAGIRDTSDPAWAAGAAPCDSPAECGTKGTADCETVGESAGVRAGRGAAAAAAARAAQALSPQEADALTIAVPRVFVPVAGAGAAAGHGGGEGGGASSRGASPPLPDYHACFQGF